NEYVKGIKVTDAEMALLALERDEFHGEWNYTLYSQQY
ncbi:MAG: ISAzo13-like element transposase-related protein, partial [Candidatus Anammoxibacter sp.]